MGSYCLRLSLVIFRLILGRSISICVKVLLIQYSDRNEASHITSATQSLMLCKLEKKEKCSYSIKAPKTKRMQASIHASMAVSPSAFGVLVVTVLKMLTKTRKSVTSNAILPGMTSIGMRKLIQLTITKRPDGK